MFNILQVNRTFVHVRTKRYFISKSRAAGDMGPQPHLLWLNLASIMFMKYCPLLYNFIQQQIIINKPVIIDKKWETIFTNHSLHLFVYSRYGNKITDYLFKIVKTQIMVSTISSSKICLSLFVYLLFWQL